MPEVENPPDIHTGSHMETPRMRRRKAEYIKKNPQVRQVCGPTALERDAELWEDSEESVDDDEIVQYEKRDDGRGTVAIESAGM